MIDFVLPCIAVLRAASLGVKARQAVAKEAERLRAVGDVKILPPL